MFHKMRKYVGLLSPAWLRHRLCCSFTRHPVSVISPHLRTQPHSPSYPTPHPTPRIRQPAVRGQHKGHAAF